jgi:hypothetical protein
MMACGGAPGIALLSMSPTCDSSPSSPRQRQTYAVLGAAEAALVTSGTATLETAIFRGSAGGQLFHAI